MTGSPSTPDDAYGCLGLLSAAGRCVEFAAAAMVMRVLQYITIDGECEGVDPGLTNTLHILFKNL